MMATTRLVFEVLGHPEPAGSKRGFKTKTGKVVVAEDNPLSAGWKHEVALAALAAMMRLRGNVDGEPPTLFDGPLGIAIVFSLQRPKGHFGSGRNAGQLKPSAPPFPIVKPDSTKLLRGVEDAMSGVVWRDDAQVVEQFVSKRYGTPERVQVSVWMV